MAQAGSLKVSVALVAGKVATGDSCGQPVPVNHVAWTRSVWAGSNFMGLTTWKVSLGSDMGLPVGSRTAFPEASRRGSSGGGGTAASNARTKSREGNPPVVWAMTDVAM